MLRYAISFFATWDYSIYKNCVCVCMWKRSCNIFAHLPISHCFRCAFSCFVSYLKCASDRTNSICLTHFVNVNISGRITFPSLFFLITFCFFYSHIYKMKEFFLLYRAHRIKRKGEGWHKRENEHLNKLRCHDIMKLTFLYTHFSSDRRELKDKTLQFSTYFHLILIRIEAE